jgi:hypothetical protein
MQLGTGIIQIQLIMNDTGKSTRHGCKMHTTSQAAMLLWLHPTHVVLATDGCSMAPCTSSLPELPAAAAAAAV